MKQKFIPTHFVEMFKDKYSGREFKGGLQSMKELKKVLKNTASSERLVTIAVWKMRLKPFSKTSAISLMEEGKEMHHSTWKGTTRLKIIEEGYVLVTLDYDYPPVTARSFWKAYSQEEFENGWVIYK